MTDGLVAIGRRGRRRRHDDAPRPAVDLARKLIRVEASRQHLQANVSAQPGQRDPSLPGRGARTWGLSGAHPCPGTCLVGALDEDARPDLVAVGGIGRQADPEIVQPGRHDDGAVAARGHPVGVGGVGRVGERGVPAVPGDDLAPAVPDHACRGQVALGRLTVGLRVAEVVVRRHVLRTVERPSAPRRRAGAPGDQGARRPRGAGHDADALGRPDEGRWLLHKPRRVLRARLSLGRR